MQVDTFLAERRPSWQQLEGLLTQTKTNIRRLSAQELEELGRLYRSTTSDLALAQRDFPMPRSIKRRRCVVAPLFNSIARNFPYYTAACYHIRACVLPYFSSAQ